MSGLSIEFPCKDGDATTTFSTEKNGEGVSLGKILEIEPRLDPFLSKVTSPAIATPTYTVVVGNEGLSEPGHQTRFNNLLSAAVKPPKSFGRT